MQSTVRTRDALPRALREKRAARQPSALRLARRDPIRALANPPELASGELAPVTRRAVSSARDRPRRRLARGAPPPPVRSLTRLKSPRPPQYKFSQEPMLTNAPGRAQNW